MECIVRARIPSKPSNCSISATDAFQEKWSVVHVFANLWKMFFIDTLDGCFQSSLRPTGYVERIRLLPIAQNRLDTEENPIKCSSLGQLSL